MLRLPYGQDTESIDRFSFEELTTPNDHARHLWGNPAVICTSLLADAFADSGWNLTGALQVDVAGLPMHVYSVEGEKQTIPCAETYLTERAMQALIDKGLMPLISIKGRDALRVARFQSIAKPAAPLAGHWR